MKPIKSPFAVAFAVVLAASTQASIIVTDNYAAWSSTVGPQTVTTIPDPSPLDVIYLGYGDASVTYGGVTFSQSGSLGGGNFGIVGPLFTGHPAALTSQEANFGVGSANFLITLPKPVTAFALNFGTFQGNPVTFELNNGDSFILTGVVAGDYSTPNFAGATTTTPFSTILLTTPDIILDINNLVTANAVPEPSTLIAGALALIPLAAGLLRKLRPGD